MQIDFSDFSLRSWRESDLDSLVRHANNPRVSSDLRDRFPFPYTEEVGKRWLAAQLPKRPETNFAITVDDQVVGGIGLEVKEDIERVMAELGYWLGEEYWRRGIVSRAVPAITDYGFTQLGLTHIFAIIFTRNIGSAGVLEKAGFEFQCTLRRSAIKQGQILDQHLYALVR